MRQRHTSVGCIRNGCRVMMHGLCRSVRLHSDNFRSETNQSKIPAGATLLGTVLSSDKTNISVLMGDCVAHPLLISLANIKMATWLKPFSCAFLLAALLLVPKFIHKNKRMKGVLEDRLIHQCLDIILELLHWDEVTAQVNPRGSFVRLHGLSSTCFYALNRYAASTTTRLL